MTDESSFRKDMFVFAHSLKLQFMVGSWPHSIQSQEGKTVLTSFLRSVNRIQTIPTAELRGLSPSESRSHQANTQC